MKNLYNIINCRTFIVNFHILSQQEVIIYFNTKYLKYSEFQLCIIYVFTITARTHVSGAAGTKHPISLTLFQ